MKSFVLFALTAASAEVFTQETGTCNPHSLLDERQCEELSDELGIYFGGGSTCEGTHCAPRGCYLYNQIFAKEHSSAELGFFYNSGKTGECTKARTCHCDSKQHVQAPVKKVTNDLVVLAEGACDIGTGLDLQQCQSLAKAQALSFTGTTCEEPNCAPPGCYLFNGRAEEESNYLNVVGFTFNDYKTGPCTGIRSCYCRNHRNGEGSYGVAPKEPYAAYRHGKHRPAPAAYYHGGTPAYEAPAAVTPPASKYEAPVYEAPATEPHTNYHSDRHTPPGPDVTPEAYTPPSAADSRINYYHRDRKPQDPEQHTNPSRNNYRNHHSYGSKSS